MASDAGALTTMTTTVGGDAAANPVGNADAPRDGAALGLATRMLAALPAEVRDGLSQSQREAFVEAAREQGWSKHPTDIRLSIPFLGKRYYLVLLGGEERRSKERLAAERNRYPLRTLTNLMFMGLFSICCTFVGGFLFTLLLIWYLSL